MAFSSFIKFISSHANQLTKKSTAILEQVIDAMDLPYHCIEPNFRYQIAEACDGVAIYSKFLADAAMHVDFSNEHRFFKTLYDEINKHDPGSGLAHETFVLTKELLHVFEEI